MKKFYFRFTTVEKVRKAEEQEAQLEFAKAQRALDNEIQIKETLLFKMRESIDRRELLGEETFNSASYQIEDDFIQGSKRRVIQADHRIKREQKKVSAARGAFINARKNVKTLEKLKERDMVQFKKDLKKQERKQLDNFYIYNKKSEEFKYYE